jgi:hypothetical protein
MLYDYEVVETGQVIEVEHPISQPALTEYTLEDGRKVNVRRLISGSTKFVLKGGNWARDGYSVGIQNPAQEMRDLKQWEKSRK